MSKKAAIIIAIIIVAFLGFLIFLGISKDTINIDFSAYDTARPIPADENNGEIADHVRGTLDAEVFLVMYADFSCAMCGESHNVLEDYVDSKDGRVAIIFRNFPVQSIHPNSIAAASAAEAAGLIKKPASLLEDEATQEKIQKGLIDDTYYFEMSEILFKNRTVWWSITDGTSRTNALVDQFRLIAPDADTDEFLSLMNSQRVKSKINFDLALVHHQGVTGTPTFFLDNKKLEGVNNMGHVESIVKPAIEAKLKESATNNTNTDTDTDTTTE